MYISSNQFLSIEDWNIDDEGHLGLHLEGRAYISIGRKEAEDMYALIGSYLQETEKDECEE